MSKVPQEILKVDLPPGFHLEEEEHTVILFHKGKEVAKFTSNAFPEKIEEAVTDYLKKIRE